MFKKVSEGIYYVYNDDYLFKRFITEEDYYERKILVDAYRQKNINSLLNQYKLNNIKYINVYPVLKRYGLYMVFLDSAIKANNIHAVNELRNNSGKNLINEIIEMYIDHDGYCSYQERWIFDYIMKNKEFRNNLLIDVKNTLENTNLIMDYDNLLNKDIDLFGIFNHEDKNFIKDLIVICNSKVRKELFEYSLNEF